MESRDARRLTTWLVALGLGAAVLCLLVGGVLALREPPAPGQGVLAFAQLGDALAAGRPAGWLTLGVLCLVLTPSLRLSGMLLTFRAEERPNALVAGALVLVLLLASLTQPLWRG